VGGSRVVAELARGGRGQGGAGQRGVPGWGGHADPRQAHPRGPAAGAQR
jgi:hypothetical protein